MGGHKSLTTAPSTHHQRPSHADDLRKQSIDNSSSMNSSDEESSEEETGETIDQNDTLKVSKQVTKNRRKVRTVDPKKKSEISTKTSTCNDKSCCVLF